jgi:tetratricopeptide (TPR) repeat protein
MAKLRRTPTRRAVSKTSTRRAVSRTSTRRAVSKPKAKPRKPAAAPVRAKIGQKPKSRPASAVQQRVPPPRSTYAEAIATYERGLAAIQKKQYRIASDTLLSVLERFPEEKELHERVGLYLRVCKRHLDPVDTTARTPEEQVYAATLAVNAGTYDRAIELATGALKTNPEFGNAEYILSVALTLKGDIPSASAHLRRAIDLNPENRELARRDADLDALRRQEDVKTLLTTQSAHVARKDRKPAVSRPRGGSR